MSENAHASGRMSRAVYSSAEVIGRFEENIRSLDLKREIADLGLGLDSFFRRGRSLQEFTALCVVLWKLALERSFPEEAENFFLELLEKSPVLGKFGKRRRMRQKVETYLELTKAHKDGDFTPVAAHISQSLGVRDKDRKALQLKLSLNIRKIYQTLFDHLI